MYLAQYPPEEGPFEVDCQQAATLDFMHATDRLASLPRYLCHTCGNQVDWSNTTNDETLGRCWTCDTPVRVKTAELSAKKSNLEK